MKAILGRKLGMSQVFSPEGEVVPVTLIFALPNIVTIRRTVEKDGYAAVQLALPKKEGAITGEKRSTSEETKVFSAKREFAGELPEDAQSVSVEQFTSGDPIEVTGVSKGKGYAGVVKRHNFKGGPASHGHRHVLRRPGSIGSRFPQHVRKGKRMAGRMGQDKVTVKNLTIVAVDAKSNVVAVKGAVPGPRGSLVLIRGIESK
jgi:large subunit ribosomal protein L3